MTDERAAEDIDLERVVDQAKVTSTVEVRGALTVRTYSDGTVQRNTWETAERAQEYADSVHAQEGTK